MRISTFTLLLLLSFFSAAESLKVSDLPGEWEPSGQMPREASVNNYQLKINPDLTASYEAIGSDTVLRCDYKPSVTQDSIFVFYCYLDQKHMITLSVGGWVSIQTNERMLYGYEYWLGYPRAGQIHGGLPVSLSFKSI